MLGVTCLSACSGRVFRPASSICSVFSLQLGRPFRGEEDAYGRNQVVILSHQLWQKRFGARNDIIGQSLTLNDKSLTIVGVMPADFTYPAEKFSCLPHGLFSRRTRGA